MARPRPGTHSIQAIAFLLAAVAGTSSIIGLKALGFSQIVITLAPVFVMACYAALVIRPFFRARADQMGDNLYYLGFIFTLVSLSTSLVAFARGGSPQEIVSNFGIALATTLLGVTLRVALNLMRTDPIETEHEARLQLAEASRRLKVELTGAMAEFNIAARANRQTVSDSILEMRRTVEDTLKRVSTSVEATIRQTGRNLEAASGELDAQVRAAAASVSEASGALRKAIEKTAADWSEATAENVGRHKELGSATQKLIATVEKAAARMEAGIAPVEAVETRLRALAEGAAKLEESLAQATEGLSATGATVDDIVAKLRAAEETSSRIAGELAASAAVVVELLAGQREAQAKTAQAAAQAAALGEAATGIVDRLGEAHEKALRIVDSAVTQSAKVAQAAEVFGKASELVEAAATTPAPILEALERLDRHLVESNAATVSGIEAVLDSSLAKSQAGRVDPADLYSRLDGLSASLSALADGVRAPRPGRGEAAG